MIGDYPPIAYHYCSPCEVETGPTEPNCWLCGLPAQPIPFTDEHMRSNLFWQISAQKAVFDDG